MKKPYKLWVVQAEYDAIKRALTKPKCDGEPRPKGGLAPKVKATKPKPSPTSTPEPESVFYENCTAVRDAGADPLRRGDPGYASHLDRDGAGCE